MAELHAYMSIMHVSWHLSGPGFVAPNPSSVSATAVPITQESYLPQHPPQQWQQHAAQQNASTTVNAQHALRTDQQPMSAMGVCTLVGAAAAGTSMVPSATAEAGTTLFMLFMLLRL
jgi:predicted component of type VI protein secretion system